jgi:membrane-bound lytic murein transglycosylase A
MIRRINAFAALVFATAFLSACVSPPRKPVGPAIGAFPPINAVAAGLMAGPSFDTLGIDAAAAQRARTAFSASCPALMRREDASGLTRGSDWQAACLAATATQNAATQNAATQNPADAPGFFRTHFETVQVGTGAAFATGYYEPEIAGSKTPLPGYAAVYARPADLVERSELSCPPDYPAGMAPAVPACKRVTRRGRLQDDAFIPYFDRGEIEDGALAGRGLEFAWVADPIEFFVLQIQGSGKLRLPDGRVMRLAYDGQNGREYTGIGRVMRERGLLQPGKATMQDIVAWLRANPEPGRAIMRENKSWIFFKELTGPGPIGALNLPVVARASVAADPQFIPLGAPVILRAMDRIEANGLWIAQDTGGAIKGANRVDTFWGDGEQALAIAGGMASRGSALLLVPRGTLARFKSRAPIKR